jgi:hypothetical protein
MNLTTKKQTEVTTPRVWRDDTGAIMKDAAGNDIETVVQGLEAVWIMEAPSFNGFALDLANYNMATMSIAYASPTDSRTAVRIPYQRGGSLQLTMVNGGNRLSTVEPIDFQSMRFTWHAFY